MVDSIFFTEKLEDCGGRLIIEGITINHGSFDPVAQLWAEARKSNRNDFQVDVAGTFKYIDSNTTICKFLLNTANLNASKKIIAESKFRDSFSRQMLNFENILITFSESPEGLEAYNKAAEEGKEFHELEQIIDKFLVHYGFRKPKKAKNSPKNLAK